MTFGTLAFAHETATHPSKSFRAMLGAVLGLPMTTHANAATPTTRGGGYGVVGSGDLLVTTTGSLGYSVAAGYGIVTGTFALGQGPYAVYNDAAVTGTIAARDATNPRITLLCVRVRDTDVDATGSEDVGIFAVNGTAAASPTVPAIASSLGSLLVLSEVLVPSSASGAALTYTDRRQFVSAIGGTLRTKSTTLPTAGALYPGLSVYETDTGSNKQWNGSAWNVTDAGAPVAWSTCSISMATWGAMANTVTRGWYQQINGVFHGHMTAALTATIGMSGIITLTLPITLANLEDIGGTFSVKYVTGPPNLWHTGVVIPISTTTVQLIVHGSSSPMALGTFTIGDQFRFDLTGRY